MKNKVLTILAMFCLCLASAYAEPLTDLARERFQTDPQCGEFSPVEPQGMERPPERPRCAYISYIQNDPEKKVSFVLQLYEVEKEYVLALFEDFTELEKPFGELSVSERLKMARVYKVIPKELAQCLYETWAQALVKATYLNARRITTGSEFYYISLFSFGVITMAAESQNKIDGKTTGYITGIAIELRNYLLDTNESELWQKILLGKCNAYLRYAQSGVRR